MSRRALDKTLSASLKELLMEQKGVYMKCTARHPGALPEYIEPSADLKDLSIENGRILMKTMNLWEHPLNILTSFANVRAFTRERDREKQEFCH